MIKSTHQSCYVRRVVLRNFTKFTGKHLCQSLFLNKVAGLRSATLLKKKLWHRCFPVNFAKVLRTSFLQNTSGQLLLNGPFICKPIHWFLLQSNGLVSFCRKHWLSLFLKLSIFQPQYSWSGNGWVWYRFNNLPHVYGIWNCFFFLNELFSSFDTICIYVFKKIQ